MKVVPARDNLFLYLFVKGYKKQLYRKSPYTNPAVYGIRKFIQPKSSTMNIFLRLVFKALYCLFLLPIICLQLAAQPSLSYKPVITSLTTPIDIAHANDGSNRLFIAQQNGIIKVFDQSLQLVGDFITVTGLVSGGERGLLSMAFHPGYKTNGFFFVYYTNLSGNLEIARYKVSSNPNIADPASKTIIITIPHPGFTNHNGGKLNFGKDGYLYFATGDGGSGGDPSNNAQNGNSLLGKMLRIDVNNTSASSNYSIPTDNPYINNAEIADEIWALGLRNPWRWSFDRLTHDMWIADVGQATWEEINFRKASETKAINYGWRCYEATHSFNTSGCQEIAVYTPPIFEYAHNNATGGFSVTGGFVYRGAEYPSLNGYYIFADYISGNQWMTYDSATILVTKKQNGTFPTTISSFGESENGTIYACALTTGIIYKIEANTGVAFQLIDFSGVVKNNVTELKWSTNTEQNLLQYEIEASTDSIHFQKKGIVAAQNLAAGNSYTFHDNAKDLQKIYYRFRIVNKDGKWDYSKTITVINNSGGINFIYPSVITNGIINIFITDSYDYLQLYSMNGSLILKKDISNVTGRIDIPIPYLSKGIYIVKIGNSKGQLIQKIFVY